MDHYRLPRHRDGRAVAVAMLLALSAANPVGAQGLGAARPEAEQPSARSSRLGPTPGAGANPLGDSPGEGGAVLENRSSGPRSATGAGAQGPRIEAAPEGGSIGLPIRSAIDVASPYGSLALTGEDEGPANGLTLDGAIERLIRQNIDLRSKQFEIPQADADILTAGLRANPILYTDVQCYPYGAFTRFGRPGGQTQYDVNVSYPLDVTRKRQARTLVACRAKKVLEAQFQDATRVEVDNLYTEFVDVLAARETVRLARKSVAELGREPRRIPGRLAPLPGAEDQRMEIQRESAELGLVEAEEQYKADLRALGQVLGMTVAQAERLEVRGSLADLAPPPVPGEPLLRLALASRPDLAAYRLGVQRAEADVGLAVANRYPDLYVLYQPYTFQDNRYLQGKNSTSWGAGVSIPLTIFNRNQGNIERARLNVSQSRTELTSLEQQVAFEVRQAERQYATTRTAIERIERSLLPNARLEHDQANRLYAEGKLEELAFLSAERDFDQVIRLYRDTLVRHRRAMLKLNTAVGLRILP
jgi:cobalt-zinc-cadmium efflux system outer membrane protein